MHVIGIGIDIVEVDRLKAALARRPRLAERLFTKTELESAGGPGHRLLRLAARFAAKEALLKSFGTGLRGVRWREAEVVSDALGRPSLRLQGQLQSLASRLGVTELHLTMSHSRQYAVAAVVAVGEDGDPTPTKTAGD